MADIFERLTKDKGLELFYRVITSLFLLYIFLIGVSCLSDGFKMLGNDFAKSLFNMTSNPFTALMAGMLATVLVQSSSVTTSVIVGLVSAGTLSMGGAVPMIMGANLGTSVTNTLVSLGYARDRENFKKAFAAATVHDFFNILTVLILLPFEIATGFIEKISTATAAILFGSTFNSDFSSPIKTIIKPVVHTIKEVSTSNFGAGQGPGIFMVVISGVFIIVSLTLIVKVMSSFVAEQEGHVLDKIFTQNSWAAMVFGVFITIAAQSSSITTSLLIPLAGSGMLTIQSVYPVTVGANIGTTATALLAALTGNMAGLAIALVHLFFNILGTLFFFAVPFTRRLPIFFAQALAGSIDRTKAIGFGYVGVVFFVLPLSMIYLF